MPHTRTRSVADPLEYYLSEISRIPVINCEQERHLAQMVADGDVQARDQMIVSNLGLVVTIARAYSASGLPFEELVGEGTLGLVRAVESFDAGLGTRFATYATYWIRQSIRQAINRDRNTVRLPHYMLNLLAKWHQAENALRRETGSAPTEEEIAARLGLSRKRTRAVREALRVRGSGQAPDTDEADDVLARIADEKGSAPAESLAALDERRAAADWLGSLTDREGEILRRRFGLDGGAPATLREVGAQLGCTRERVRQIENAALAKLRPHFEA